MKYSVKDAGQCVKTLTVEVSPDDVAAAREAVERQVQRAARVPGFRVGHAPRELVVQHYAPRVREETIRRVVGERLPQAIQEAKLDLLGDPEVTQVTFDEGRPLTFIARCEVMPAIPLRPLRGITITRPAVTVTDARVEEVLTRLREQQAELVPVVDPRPLTAGDYAVADITCVIEGRVVESRPDAVIEVAPDHDASGISRHVLGVAPGAPAVTFEATLPGTLRAKAYAGKPATFTVTVKSVKVKQMPPLDEAFATRVGAASLEALRARVRDDLTRELTAQARRAAEDQLLQKLVEQTPFDVPASLLQSQAQRLLRQAQLELLYQGAPPDELDTRHALLADRSKQDALRQVKRFFLLRQVAAAQGLTATEQEITERIEALAAQSQRSAADVRAELARQRLLAELAWEITQRKVMEYVFGQVTIQEVAA